MTEKLEKLDFHQRIASMVECKYARKVIDFLLVSTLFCNESSEKYCLFRESNAKF